MVSHCRYYIDIGVILLFYIFMTFNQVREKLLKGKHTIRYKSLTTEGKEHEIVGSLLNVNLFQSESTKILVFSPDENRWLDIEVSTILSVEPV
jgi:hypothetical protein